MKLKSRKEFLNESLNDLFGVDDLDLVKELNIFSITPTKNGYFDWLIDKYPQHFDTIKKIQDKWITNPIGFDDFIKTENEKI